MPVDLAAWRFGLTYPGYGWAIRRTAPLLASCHMTDTEGQMLKESP